MPGQPSLTSKLIAPVPQPLLASSLLSSLALRSMCLAKQDPSNQIHLVVSEHIFMYPLAETYTITEGPGMNKQQSLLRRLEAIEQLLQDMRNDILTDEVEDVEVEIVQVPGQGAWHRQMLVEFCPYIEHLPGVLALMDLASEHAPEPVSYAEIKLRSGLSDRQQRNDHAALTRIAKQVFGRRTWPFAWRQTADGAMQYWMPTRMADWWRELRKGPSTG